VIKLTNPFQKRVKEIAGEDVLDEKETTNSQNSQSEISVKNMSQKIEDNLLKNSNLPHIYKRDFFEVIDNENNVQKFKGKSEEILEEISQFKRFTLQPLEKANYIEANKPLLDKKASYIYATGTSKEGMSRGTGTGKTELAVIVLKEFSKKYAEYFAEQKKDFLDISPFNKYSRNDYLDYPYFIHSSEFFNTLRDNYSANESKRNTDLIRKVKDASILVWDDLLTEKITEFSMEQMQRIINHRYEAELPTIFTSNYKLEKLDNLNYQNETINRQGERIYSRISEMLAGEKLKFRMEGKDKRVKKNLDKQEKNIKDDNNENVISIAQRLTNTKEES